MLTLVLLPGMDGTGNLFDPFIAALKGGCKVRIVRYPADQALGYAELEAIARRALPTTGKFVLLGESFSGPIAVSIAASAPKGLAGVVLCATFVRNPYPVFAPFAALAGVLPVKAAPAFAMRHLLLGEHATPAVLAALQAALASVSATALRARIQAVASVDVTDQLHCIQVPMLYLRATRDRVIPDSAARLIADRVAHLQVASIDAPHFLLQAAPVAAARAVGLFMQSLQAPASRSTTSFTRPTRRQP